MDARSFNRAACGTAPAAPAVRRFRPRTYRLAAVQPLIVTGAGDLEEPLPWWLAAAAPAGAGITAGYKSIPFDHVRFD